MCEIKDIFGQKLNVLNIGTVGFRDDLALQEVQVTQIHWAPPADGNEEIIELLDQFAGDERVKKANEEAVSRILDSSPVLIGMEQARNVIPGMTDNMILHSGPPTTWEGMCGTMQGAIIGALIYEGRAENEKEARALAESGAIRFESCHEHNAVGPMSGIISPSMAVHIIENKTYGNRAYCNINEGLGKVLRFGAFDESVINRLRWLESDFYPVMKKALEIHGELDLKVMIAQAVQMGDECHNRNKAATSLFFREMIPSILETGYPMEQIQKVIEFIRSNDHYFLNLSMPSCKSTLDAANGVPYSTILTTMARNGVEFGIRVSGLGTQWFTAPAEYVQGLLFPGFTEEDANPDLGDSAITETMGIGGFAMGASPAITRFVGGTVQDATNYTKSMYTITTAENSNFSLPAMDFRGTATGIDMMKVLESGTLPVINTGIAHKVPGIGQIGAGIVHPPKDCFVKAMIAFGEKYGQEL